MFLCKYDFLYLYCIYSFQYFLLIICLSIKNLFFGNNLVIFVIIYTSIFSLLGEVSKDIFFSLITCLRDSRYVQAHTFFA